MPPDAAQRRPRVKAKARAQPRSSTARQGAAFGTRAAKTLPRPRPSAAPKFKPVATPDQSQGRPTEPVKQTVRARHKGGKIVRHVTTLPDVAHAQAHLDRLVTAKARRAQLRHDYAEDTPLPARHDPIAFPKQAKIDKQIVEDADRKIRIKVRAEARAQRKRDDADINLAGVSKGTPERARQYSRGIDREARKLTPEVHKAARKLPRADRDELHTVAVKAAHVEGRQPAGFTQRLHDEPAASANVIGQVTAEANKRELARATREKLARGDVKDVVGNSKKFLSALKDAPASAVEMAKVLGENAGIARVVSHGVGPAGHLLEAGADAAQHFTHADTKKKPHTKTFVKAQLTTAPGQLAQGVASNVQGKGSRGHFKEAARQAALDPIGTALTVVPAVGWAAKGAEFASVAGKVAKAGKAARSGEKLHVRVNKTIGQRRIRENLTVNSTPTPRGKVSVARTRAGRRALKRGSRTHARGDVATKARVYAKNPVYRAVQRGREDVKAARGIDPHEASTRGGRFSAEQRAIKGDRRLKINVTARAGQTREAEAAAGIVGDAARGTGANRRAREARSTEREALRGSRVRVSTPKVRAERAARAQLFSKMQQGIVEDAATLAAHIRTHVDALKRGTDLDGKKLTAEDRLAVQENLDELKTARDLGLIDDPNLHAAAAARQVVTSGQDVLRALRIEGGERRMRLRDRKVVRYGRDPLFAGGGDPADINAPGVDPDKLAATLKAASAKRAAEGVAPRAPVRPEDLAPTAIRAGSATATTKLRVTKTGRQAGEDPGYLVDDHPLHVARSLRDENRAEIDRLEQEIAENTHPVHPMTRAPLSRHHTPAQRKANRGKKPGDKGYRESAYEKAMSRQAKRHKKLAEAYDDAITYGEMVVRGRHEQANMPGGAIPRPAVGRTVTYDTGTRGAIGTQRRIVNELRDQKRRAPRKEADLREFTRQRDKIRDIEAAHRRHAHMVLGHPLRPEHRHPKGLNQWQQYDRYRPLIKFRAGWKKKYGSDPPNKASHTKVLHEIASDLRARRRHHWDRTDATTGGVQAILEQAGRRHAWQVRQNALRKELEVEQGDLDRAKKARTIAKDNQAAEAANFVAEGGQAWGSKRWRGEDFDKSVEDMEQRISGLQQQIDETPDPLVDVLDVSDEALNALTRETRILNERTGEFEKAQSGRLAALRARNRELVGLRDRVVRQQNAPADLDARLAEAEAKLADLEAKGTVVQAHVNDQTRQVLRTQARDEQAGTSMHPTPENLGDFSHLKHGAHGPAMAHAASGGHGAAAPTSGLEAKIPATLPDALGDRLAEGQAHRIDAEKNRPELRTGSAEGLGSARASLERDMPEPRPVGEHVGLTEPEKGWQPIPRNQPRKVKARLMPKPTAKGPARAAGKPRLTPYRRTLLELRRQELAGERPQGPANAPRLPDGQPLPLAEDLADLHARNSQAPPEVSLADETPTPRVEAREAGRQPRAAPGPKETPRQRKTRLQRERRAAARNAQKAVPALKTRMQGMVADRPAQAPRTAAGPMHGPERGPTTPKRGTYATTQPPEPKPEPPPIPKGVLKGSFVPTERELAKHDTRLGVSPIRGAWSHTDLLTNRWGKYDPAESHSRLERSISADAVRREILKSAHHGETTLTEDAAHARITSLTRRKPGSRWAAVQTKDGTDSWAVMPKVIADAWHASQHQPGLFGRGVRYANTRFVRAVLPLSATWHLGNAVDMATRLALSGARPGDEALQAHLHEALGKVDENWARHVLDGISGTHFTSQHVDRAKVIAHIPKLGKAADQLLSAGGALDKVFAAAKGVEGKGSRVAQGTALRQQMKALGQEHADVQTMVRNWKARPELVQDFQRRTLEIVGDYVNTPRWGKRDLRVAAPFVQWINASLKFTFATLPAKHPIKTALLMNLAAATREQRREIGADSLLSDKDADAMGVPRASKGFLGGAVKGPGGAMIPTGNLTSPGAGVEMVQDPTQYWGNVMFPWLSGPAGRALGSRDSAAEYALRTAVRVVQGKKNPTSPGAGRDSGAPGGKRQLGEGLSALGDAGIVGYQLAGKVRGGGRKPGLHTTTLAKIRFGAQKNPNVKSADKQHVLKEGGFRDQSRGKTYGGLVGAARVIAGPMAAPQRDDPQKRPRPNVGPGGTIVQVKALDGTYYKYDTRTGTVVR